MKKNEKKYLKNKATTTTLNNNKNWGTSSWINKYTNDIASKKKKKKGVGWGYNKQTKGVN